MGTRRLSLAALSLALLSASGCDEKQNGRSGGQDSKLGGNLLPPAADGARGTSSGGPIVRSPETQAKVEELRDSVASAYAPAASGGDPGRRFFDGQRDDGLGGDAVLPVLADGVSGSRGTATPVRYTGNPRRVSARIGDTPRPGTLPDVDLPQADPASGANGGGPVLRAFDAFQKVAYETVIPLLSRKAWGAAARRGAPSSHSPSQVTVHHTDGHPQTNLSKAIEEMRGYQRFHMGPERGWADIGYHFVLDREGRIFEGRPADTIGAHAGGHNTGNIGIAVMGDYNKYDLNEKQKLSLRRLISFLALHYHTDPSQRGFILGHTQHPGNNTDCPGTHILSFLGQLRREVGEETQRNVVRFRPGAGFTPRAVVDT